MSELGYWVESSLDSWPVVMIRVDSEYIEYDVCFIKYTQLVFGFYSHREDGFLTNLDYAKELWQQRKQGYNTRRARINEIFAFRIGELKLRDYVTTRLP